MNTLPHRQSGAVLLLFLLVFTTAASFVLVSQLNQAATQAHRDDQTYRSLAEAKAALIGYAVSDPNRPGELPCPDFNNDGQILLTGPNRDYNGSNCRTEVVSGVIQPGWIPWETVRLSDLRDGNGDRLWYVVSHAYHANSTSILNSDTPGQLSVGGTTDVVAIIFSPGLPLPNQSGRNCDPASTCDATVMLNEFLDGANAIGGANTQYVLYLNPSPGSPNDQLIAITREELMAAVEKRVLGEARQVLLNYYQKSDATPTRRFYPYAAELGDPSSQCIDGKRSGFLPLANSTGTSACTHPNPALTGLPPWFTTNQWQYFIHYTVGGACTFAKKGCVTGTFLTVGTISGIHALLISSGKPITATPFAPSKGSLQSRPSGTPNDYLDSLENADGDDSYTRLGEPLTTSFNDQGRIIAP